MFRRLFRQPKIKEVVESSSEMEPNTPTTASQWLEYIDKYDIITNLMHQASLHIDKLNERNLHSLWAKKQHEAVFIKEIQDRIRDLEDNIELLINLLQTLFNDAKQFDWVSECVLDYIFKKNALNLKLKEVLNQKEAND